VTIWRKIMEQIDAMMVETILGKKKNKKHIKKV
jgi:hypothetical protein